MKCYRIQARYLGVYLDHSVGAENEKQGIQRFLNDLSAGLVELQKETAGIVKHKCLVTIEEISDVQNSTGTHS